MKIMETINDSSISHFNVVSRYSVIIIINNIKNNKNVNDRNIS